MYIFSVRNIAFPADLTIMTAMEYAGYTGKEDAAAVTVSAVPAQLSTESRVTTS